MTRMRTNLSRSYGVKGLAPKVVKLLEPQQVAVGGDLEPLC